MPCPSGLSPLARGNRRHGAQQRACQGPIPARAGQPHSMGSAPGTSGAYPRSRGATEMPTPLPSAISGLSPLARGNLDRVDSKSPAVGPIPARAGQPLQSAAQPTSRRAYPRSRGATAQTRPSTPPLPGLSPLARGNPQEQVFWSVVQRPIPARAGQPAGIGVWRPV